MVSIGFPKNGVLWKKDEKSMPGEAQGLNIFSKSPSNPLGSLGMMDDGNMSEVLDLPTWVARCCSGVERTINAKKESLSMSTHAVSQANPVDLVPGK